MKKKKERRRKNPARNIPMPDLAGIADVAGKVLVTSQLSEWTYNECFLLAALLPAIRGMIRAGIKKEDLQKIVDSGPEVIIEL